MTIIHFLKYSYPRIFSVTFSFFVGNVHILELVSFSNFLALEKLYCSQWPEAHNSPKLSKITQESR